MNKSVRIVHTAQIMEQKLFDYMHKHHGHKYTITSPDGSLYHVYADGSIIKDTTLKLPPLK